MTNRIQEDAAPQIAVERETKFVLDNYHEQVELLAEQKASIHETVEMLMVDEPGFLFSLQQALTTKANQAIQEYEAFFETVQNPDKPGVTREMTDAEVVRFQNVTRALLLTHGAAIALNEAMLQVAIPDKPAPPTEGEQR